ncbi:MAG: acyl-ACP desaturase, partial [Dehalococcoidia bacterium]
MPNMDLLTSLEPQMAALLERHKEAAARTDWSYHEFLPLEAYRAERNRPKPLSEVAYTAVETALLTEVILPWYTTALCRRLDDASGSLAEFVRQWTSEEDQHSTLLETYLLITANGDHAERNATRKQVLARGWYDDVTGPFEAVVYTSLQEMATRSFYLHAAQVCEPEETMLTRALLRIAK